MTVAWQTVASGAYSLDRAGHSSVIVGNKAYVTGGFTHDRGTKTDCMHMLVLDLTSATWERIEQPVELQGIRHHTAHVVGSIIWFIGGGAAKSIPNSLYTFDTVSRKWQSRHLRSGQELMTRTGHSSVVHPLKSHCILVYGGAKGRSRYQNDLVVLDTITEEARALRPSNAPPEARSFASLASVGDYVFLLGGRTGPDSSLVSKERSLQIYCPRTDCWLQMHSGKALDMRSSHKAVGHGRHMYVWGGAARDKSMPEELLCLTVSFSGSPSVGLKWTRVPVSHSVPSGRTAHSIAVHGDALYMFGGYGNNSYLGDAWRLVLPASQPALQGHQDLSAAARISPAKDTGAAGSRLPTATVATAKPAVQTASRRNRRPAAAKAVKEEKAGEWRPSKRARCAAVEPAFETCRFLDSPSGSPLAGPSGKCQLPFKPSQDSEMEKLQRQLLQVVDRERQLKRKLEQRDKQQADSTVELRNSLQHARNQVEAERVAKRGCEAELEQLRQSLDADSEALREELRQEMDRSTTDKGRLKEQLHTAQNQITKLEEHNRVLTSTAASGKAENVRLRHGLEKAAADAEGHQTAKTRAQAAFDEARRRLEEEADDLKRRCQEHQAQAAMWQAKFADADKSLHCERRRNDMAEEAKEKLQGEASDLRVRWSKEACELKEQLAEERRRGKSLAEEIAGAVGLAETLKAQNDALRRGAGEAEKERQAAVERLRQEKHKLTQQLQQEGQKCIAATTQRDVFYNYLQNVKAVALAAEDTRKSHESCVTSAMT